MKCVEFANAKINLYLDVSEKRLDGFHTVTTVMHQITLHDELNIEAEDSDKTQVTLEVIGGGVDIPTDEKNLVVIAIKSFLERIGRTMKIHVILFKNIPSMAGLGGGSSDAAAALRGMNSMLNSPLTTDRLEELSSTIGSDVPFFINNIKALCLGRGEILLPFKPSLKAYVVLAEGSETSSTKAAFSRLDEMPRSENVHPDFSNFTFENVYNVFEDIIKIDCPSVEKNLAVLKDFCPEAAAMSGSGSTVYGLFKDEMQAKMAEYVLRKRGVKTHFCELVQE